MKLAMSNRQLATVDGYEQQGRWRVMWRKGALEGEGRRVARGGWAIAAAFQWQIYTCNQLWDIYKQCIFICSVRKSDCRY